MPEPRDDEELELEAHDDDRRFSQEDDDRAGRSWHGMNSDTNVVGRFEEDEDETIEEAPRPGTERV